MSHAAAISDAKRHNNFGSLRLLFALCVILSHSPELVDGNRSRELLTRMFGTLSFGDIGVDGFFLISGYLITKSFVTRRSIRDYVHRRGLRIIPAYVVNFLLCVFVLSPFVTLHPSVWTLKFLGNQAWEILHLSSPSVPGTFPGLHKPDLNGSAWTISYEFRCYMITVVIGVAGAYGRRGRYILLAGIAVCLLLTASAALAGAHWHREAELGRPELLVRFFGIYGVGALFYLFRDFIPIGSKGALLAAFLLLGCLFSPLLAQTGWTIFGAYLIFWVAFTLPVFGLSSLENKIDISYGLYLYAWPIQNLAIYVFPSINPWALCALTMLVASLLGMASWFAVERPALAVLAAPASRPAPDPEAGMAGPAISSAETAARYQRG